MFKLTRDRCNDWLFDRGLSDRYKVFKSSIKVLNPINPESIESNVLCEIMPSVNPVIDLGWGNNALDRLTEYFEGK